jgi:hypothetical protein
MEFSLNNFTERLMQLIHSSKLMPDMGSFYTDRYGNVQSGAQKHPNRPTPRDLRSQISLSMANSFVAGENINTFDIGNNDMEKNFPYYHILQQAPTIRKAHRGTTKTKGSESLYKNPAERDYERVHWNGKTFTKEYSRNVRGSRINLNKTQMHIDGQWLNTSSGQYLNIHYKYLDRICDEVAQQLAKDFDIKLGRKKDTGLIEEFAMQEEVTVESVLEAFDSLM